MVELVYTEDLKSSAHKGLQVRSLPGASIMDETKRCSKCLKIQPLSEYWKRKKSYDGLRYECRTCVSTYIKEHNSSIPTEVRKQKQKEYLKRHKEKDLQRYNRMHRERMTISRRKKGIQPRNLKAKRGKLGKELSAEPLRLTLSEWRAKGNMVSSTFGKDSTLARAMTRVLTGEVKTIREEQVDMILIAINEEDRFNELYPI